MRLSSLGLAAVLLFSSIVFAQHHEAAAPSSPPPAPAPSAPPSPAPAPAAAPSAAPSASVSHTSEPSAPVSARAPEIPAAPSAGASTSHISGPTFTQSNSSDHAPVVRTPESGVQRVIPQERITGDERIAPGARIGENPPEKEREPKPADPNLRHWICEGATCKEPVKPFKPQPPDSDLRHPVCPGGVCRCPAGQKSSKGGCVTESVDQTSSQCQTGEWWNGADCVRASTQCGDIINRGEMLRSELRSLSGQIQNACSQDPLASDCEDLKMRRGAALQQYRMLQNEAMPNCTGQLLEPPL